MGTTGLQKDSRQKGELTMVDSTWTVEQVAILRELWPQKEHTARAIGAIVHMTKNAVISKANRLHLPAKRRISAGKGRKRRTPTKAKPFIWRWDAAERKEPTPLPMQEPAVGGGIPFLEVEPHHCRAVIGKGDDGLALYCGNEKMVHPIYREGIIQPERRAFCPWHCKKYYLARKNIY